MLDEGGKLLSEIVPELNFYSSNIIGIEQTSSGYNLLKNTEIKFPIINVARSFIKLTYESPLIAQTVSKQMLKNLQSISINEFAKILIIGKGIIGKAIYKVIKSKYKNVLFYDTCEKKSSFTKNDFRKKLHYFDIIIGCSGTNSISSNDYPFLKKNVILISASSSDIEFDAIHLRKQLDFTDICHKNIFVDNVHLINNGFPINFCSNFEDADPKEFELTRSILLLAIIQANNYKVSEKPDFISLDSNIQNKIIKKFLEIYKKNKNLMLNYL